MKHNVRINFVKAFSDFEGILLIIDLVRESPPHVLNGVPPSMTLIICDNLFYCVFVFVGFIFTKHPSPLANPSSVPHAHWCWNTPLVAEVGTKLYLQA